MTHPDSHARPLNTMHRALLRLRRSDDDPPPSFPPGTLPASLRLTVTLASLSTGLLVFPPLLRSPLAIGTAALALAYSTATLLIPHAKEATLEHPPATTTLDALLIAAWIHATGGAASPYYVLWLIAIAFVAIRFTPKHTTLACLGYLALHSLLATLSGHLLTPTFLTQAALLAATAFSFTQLNPAWETPTPHDPDATPLGPDEWRALLDDAPEVLMMLDADGAIRYTNLAATDDALDALQGQPATDWLPERSHDRFHQALHEVTQQREPATLEIESRRPDGTPSWYLLRLAPVEDDARTLGASLVCIDITHLRQAEQDLEANHRELERSHDLLSTYMRLTAHDLQEPLADVTRYAQMLEDQNPDHLPDEHAEASRFAIQGAKRIMQLIDALGRLTKLTTRSLRPEPTPGHRLAQQALHEVQHLHEDAPERVQIDDQIPPLHADAESIRETLREILDNAIRYADDATVHVHGEHDGHTALLYVDDDGPGIQEAYRERVQEPFRRLHGWHQEPGTGIGLAYAKEAIRRNHGTLTIQESPQGGTRIRLELPAPARTPESTPAGTLTRYDSDEPALA